MTDEIRYRVLAAVASGQLPRGGPSDMAARRLVGELLDGYWQSWGAKAAARIRARPQCCCGEFVELSADDRCERCFGYGMGRATCAEAACSFAQMEAYRMQFDPPFGGSPGALWPLENAGGGCDDRRRHSGGLDRGGGLDGSGGSCGRRRLRAGEEQQRRSDVPSTPLRRPA